MFLLIARNTEDLELTRQNIADVSPVLVITQGLDLGKVESGHFADMIHETLKGNSCKASDFDAAIVIHNAGSLGNQGKPTREMTDFAEMENYFRLNLFSPIVLNAVFLQMFVECKNIYVINISSLCASQPFKTWGSYCTGKAARTMFFKVIYPFF